MASGHAVAGPGGHGDSRATSGYAGPERTTRAGRTRTLLIDALIDLIGEGNPSPTARQVVEQAKVTRRTLYHHFSGLDELFAGAAGRQASQHRSLITIVPPHGPVETRVKIIVRQRRHLFEAIGPVLQATYARMPASPDLTDVLDGQRKLLRFQLVRTLAPEIDGGGSKVPVMLATLDAVTGWQAWTTLRGEAGHSASQAEQILRVMIAGILN
jgi:TetR/AcrR family transcriptional regulator of autoinduction and epiphytic fitness